jgi:phosphoglucosamine mutase
MTPLFGTDGVRGPANSRLTPELAVALARAAASQPLGGAGGRVIVGRDTRTSGPMLEAALAAGFASSGLDVRLAGIIPTPAISFLIKDERADFGAVISASHNPPQDNGIKFFNREGMKLGVEEETRIEAAIAESPCPAARIGTIAPLEAAATRYAAFLIGAIEGEHVDLSGMKIVVDCAYGATAKIAPHVLRHLGAQVIALHDSFDGERINRECGSTDLEPVRRAVAENAADLGIAFDGDGDRVLLVGRDLQAIDGDRMIGIAALHMEEAGRLSPRLVVTTVMSNLGLEAYLGARAIAVMRTPVGDRYVSERMRELGARLGGEPSGHVVFAAHSPTGDGILTAVKLLEIAHERGTDLGTLAASIPLYPQEHRNVPCSLPEQLAEHPLLLDALGEARRQLDGDGRVLVRPSGTQPLVRLLVEAEDGTACTRIADLLEEALLAARRQSDADGPGSGASNG